MFKKIFYGLSAVALLAACTDDYTDWAQPQANEAVSPKTIEWSVAAVQADSILPDSSTIFILDSVKTEKLQLFTVNLPEGMTVESFNVKLLADSANDVEAKYPDYNITADAEGYVAVADLQNAITGMFNVKAVKRVFNAVVSTSAKVKGTTDSQSIIMAAEPFTFNVTPLTPQFEPYIYFIGATDGWSGSDQKLASPDQDGEYKGFCYVADPNGWGLAFKFQRVAGSWDNEINAGNFTKMTGVTGDNNIEVAEEGLYYFNVNLAENTITAVKITNMNLVGDFNGWNAADDAQQMTWNATDFCYEITGAGVTANGWKFTANNAWDINLGGDLTNLSYGGDNISTVGTTIKLYPTRKTNDNIYCTVE